MYRMAKLTGKRTIRLARIVMPLGEPRKRSTPEPALTLPPREGNLIHLHIPLAMIEAALARHKQRPKPPKLPQDKPKKALMRFTIPLVRIEMPLDPMRRKK